MPSDVSSHISDTNNPHSVTTSQIGAASLSGINFFNDKQQVDLSSADKWGFVANSNGANYSGIYFHAGNDAQLLVRNADGTASKFGAGKYTVGSNNIWHAGNFIPSDYATLASPTFTGTVTAPALIVNGKNVASNLLAEYTVTGSAVTSIDFSGLDINTHKSYRVEIELGNATVTTYYLHVYINNDTTVANYWSQELNASSTAIGGQRNQNPTIAVCEPSSVVISNCLVEQYFSGMPGVKSQNIRNYGSAVYISLYSVSKSSTITSINRLTFTSTVANSISVGSTIRIYRNDV